ncbi:thiol reductant ABC exporter subunit CydC [Gordonia sp. ABSL11-1]|uniref:thiol reductant ABC exporter subunit CydC n=1 Tax=Gordonia sp. ABSL11-1 TaxID=3053924 RepID=UPI002573163A|nr:thiol reductant ABC exporter subunit CydC [Gordonia sp. ABSL11-1]MDL9945550.1 thiol reductant ABC exporter subunit CydC [Gordonia sp. ABSL11-1]
MSDVETASVDGAGRDPLRRAFAFLRLRGRPMVSSVLLGVGGALSALGLAALSAWLITRAWQMPPVLYLSVAITAVRALGISRGVFRYLERLATHDLALGAMATARERIYRTLAAGSPAYSVMLRRGDLLARTGDDIDEIGNALIRGVIPIAVGAVTSVAAVVIMALVSLWAAIVLAVALVVSGVIAPWLAARGAATAIADGSTASTQTSEAVMAALWHAPELIVARRREQVLATAARADLAARAAADRGLRHEAAAAAATPLSLGVSLLAACLIGVHLASTVSGSLASVASGEGLTPMILGVLILLPLSAFESTAPLTEAGIQLERSRQAAARVMALVDRAGAPATAAAAPVAAAPVAAAPVASASVAGPAEDESVTGPWDLPPHTGPVTVSTEALHWGWPGGPDLADQDLVGRDLIGADGLTMRLGPGERMVVVGPSGSGKSTLLVTIAGLLASRAGRVTVVDDTGGPVDPRSAVCYFAEEGHVFSTTVRENLLLARGDAGDDDLMAALDTVGLRSWVESLPERLDTDLVGGGEAVSGGQRRRLLLARALLHPAPVVLLDEPTEHLDADDAAAVMRRLVAADGGWFGRGRTVIVVTHHVAPHEVSAMNPDCRLLDIAPAAADR